jgi:O-methyltransferase
MATHRSTDPRMLADLLKRLFTSQREEADRGDREAAPRNTTDPGLLPPTGLFGMQFNIVDADKFSRALSLITEAISDHGATLYSSDNLITWNRNYSFLRDPFYIGILNDPSKNQVEKGIVWRSYILLYFAQLASTKAGDFMELGCYSGTSADLVTRKVAFAALKKKYYLYDRFEWKAGYPNHAMPLHSDPKLFDKVRATFADRDYVILVRGSVPDSFAEAFPEQIAFAHIDMNNAAPEVASLEAILPRLSSGGVVVLDDYGWWEYSKQKLALDPVVERYSLQILELPTGQGIIIKP